MEPPPLKMSTFVTLPEDVITDILFRLPVKSLQRFKCVAKSWNASINDLRFVINYFYSSNNHESLDLLLVNQLHTEKRQVLSLLSSEPLKIKTKHFQLSYANPIEETNSAACILGPCNGIICLFDTLFFEGDTISLWNPGNQQLKTLPKSHVKPPPNAIPLKRVAGIGFDNESNDYKVLAYRHMYFPSSPSTPTTAHAELYTLSTNSWKEIFVGEEFQPMCSQTTRPTNPSSVNEIFSWLEIENQFETVIFSFNMKKEAFSKTRLPHNPFNKNHGTLASLKDSLAYIHVHYVGNGVRYNVWVLGEYGVRESWMKQPTIGPISGKTSALGFWKNGELLLQNITRRKLVSYNLITKDMKDVQARGVFSIVKVLPYKESLVCFKEDEEETDQNTLSVTECQEEDILQMIPSTNN